MTTKIRGTVIEYNSFQTLETRTFDTEAEAVEWANRKWAEYKNRASQVSLEATIADGFAVRHVNQRGDRGWRRWVGDRFVGGIPSLGTAEVAS